MQSGEDWLKKAEKEFKAAKDKGSEQRPASLLHGQWPTKLALISTGRRHVPQVLDMNKEFTSEANAEWAVIQKIQRAAPGTVIGKQIALIEKIDRADISALFVQEMDLEKLFTKRGSEDL